MMLINRRNLETELLLERNKSKSEEDFMTEVYKIFDSNSQHKQEIDKQLSTESSTKSNNFNLDLLETDKIFHIDQIKKVCVDYRFRFLGSHLFKSEIPEEAISKIRDFESAHQTKLSGFKIAAPSKLFHLKNYDDPLLFVPLGNNYFYLLHKWGNDVNPFRKAIVRPLKNLGSFTLALVLLSLLVTAITPENILGKSTSGFFQMIVFLFTLKSFMGLALYYAFWQGKNFNEHIWNQEYYN
ncbi:MAG: hypothetical protein ACOVLC_09075 [Flavobacterium sp.]